MSFSDASSSNNTRPHLPSLLCVFWIGEGEREKVRKGIFSILGMAKMVLKYYVGEMACW